MLVGVGTDILEIGRVANVYSRHATRFKKRILTQKEQMVAANRHSIVNYLAKQFAAKEAISKALGTGIGALLSFQDIEILRDINGKPHVALSKHASEAFPGLDIHLSLSDTKTMILAFCVIERQ